ncbi:hypothetical protein ACT4ML_08170 [Natrinema sp. LN54]
MTAHDTGGPDRFGGSDEPELEHELERATEATRRAASGGVR